MLKVLTTVGDISEEKWNERYDWMSKRNDEYFLLCILDGSGNESGEGRIVGTGAVVVERKLCVCPVACLLVLGIRGADESWLVRDARPVKS